MSKAERLEFLVELIEEEGLTGVVTPELANDLLEQMHDIPDDLDFDEIGFWFGSNLDMFDYEVRHQFQR